MAAQRSGLTQALAVMSDSSFWKEVRRKRNHFFMWWIAWIPAGIAFMAAYTLIVGSHPQGLTFVFFFAWFFGWILIANRLSSIRCSRCNNKAISQPLFFMKHAKCKSCGFSYSEFLAVEHSKGHS